MNSDNPKKQTLQEVLSGEEPTEEFLEVFRLLEESEDVSDSDLTQQALAVKPVEQDIATKTQEPDYKTKESNFSIILILVALLAAAYWLTK